MRHLAPKHHFDRVMLVSGDRESEVRYLAEKVGIQEVHFRQSPEQKVELVRAETKLAPTVFMGDGINDAPALTAATVGIAFGQNSEITSEAAGAVILDSSLQKVDEFLHISRRMRSIALQSAIGGDGLEHCRHVLRRVWPSFAGCRRDRSRSHRRDRCSQCIAGCHPTARADGFRLKAAAIKASRQPLFANAEPGRFDRPVLGSPYPINLWPIVAIVCADCEKLRCTIIWISPTLTNCGMARTTLEIQPALLVYIHFYRDHRMNMRCLANALIVGLGFCVTSLAQGAPPTSDPNAPVDGSPAVRPSAARKLPGVQADGHVLLPTQWSLRPAGEQVRLGDFPVNIALHPTESWAAILHSGYAEHEVVVVRLDTKVVISRVVLPQTFYGLCFNTAGKQLFVSGAEHSLVHRFDFAAGYLTNRREIAIGDPNEKRFVPTGLSCSPDGKNLFVANAWGNTVTVVPLESPERLRHVSLKKDSYPYLALPSSDGKRLYVSLWNSSSVAVVDLATLSVEAQWVTGPHPTELILSPKADILYVACANSNLVTVLDAHDGRSLETITSSLYPQAPLGSTPNSLALSPDGKVLFIANADNNNLAVVNVEHLGKSSSLGFIPVGWYPTSVRYSPLENRIYVANGKGLLPAANRQGPNPLQPSNPSQTVQQYIGGLFRGTLGIIAPPSPGEMAKYTKEAFQCSPLKADRSAVSQPREAKNAIPAKLGGASPIKHCIYIIKENRTYDQVFGDIPVGNGDPDLCIFPDRVTPNHHALAKEFVLLDNFYVESEVSADGHEWSMAAYATDFVEKTWPLNYRDGGRGIFRYPSEGALPIAFSAGGYIWDRCKERGVSYRSYGEFIQNADKVGEPGTASMPALEGHFDPQFRSFDMDYPDVLRAKRFREELAGFEKTGEMPQFIVMRLPNDHTQGTKAGKPTPIAMVADNDLSLGQVVEAVSHSKFWKDTAIFVIEDDAQNGSDHVDAHRTVALVISPYAKRRHVDSNMYSTASMLRTMELILNLQPMTQFDAAALPMFDSFQAQADLTPYMARPATVDLSACNLPTAWGSRLSAQLDFSKEDAADDLVLNEIIWKSIRGADSTMPPPVRAGFVFAHPEASDDDD